MALVKQDHSKLQTFYLIVLFLMPVLAQYPIGPLDMDVVGILLVAVGLFFSGMNYDSTKRGIIYVLITYIAVVTLVNLMFGEMYSSRADIILRCGRYCLYLIIVMLLCLDTLFDYQKAMRIYRVIAMAAFCYICLQTVFYYGAGITLPNRIGGTSLTNESGQEVGRLRAFYSEPADMAYSLIPFVCCSLFGPQYAKKDRRMMDAICVTAAIILTTSGQGIVTVAALWFGWVCIGIAKKEMSAKKGGVILGIIAVAFILWQAGILEFALGRVADTGEHSATAARSSGYVALQLLSPFEWLFGTGFGNYVTENIYNLPVPYQFVNYSSIAEFLFTTGLVGMSILVGFFFGEFRKGDLRSRMLILALIALAVGGCPMTGKYMPIYLSLICSRAIPFGNDADAATESVQKPLRRGAMRRG